VTLIKRSLQWALPATPIVAHGVTDTTDFLIIFSGHYPGLHRSARGAAVAGASVLPTPLRQGTRLSRNVIRI